MTTARKMIPAVGLECDWAVESLYVRVHIVDVRTAWDRIDCLVRPVAGSGEKWVSCARLRPVMAGNVGATALAIA